MRRVVLAALLALWPALGQAQFALIAPTAPNSDNGDRIANTAWVQNFFATGLPLANGKIIIGSAGGIGTPQTMSGDCTLVASGVITCTQAAGNYAVIGGQIIGSPTGGNKGAGTINVATDYYKNNAIIPETVSAPLTLSAAGLLACPACVLVSATAHGDSAYAILSTDRYVYTNAAFTAPRTWTLPAASSLTAGTTIWVQDAQNTVTSTNTLTVSRAGADTINIGSTTLLITGAAGGITFTTDGVSNWGVPVQTPSTGGTGRPTLTNHSVLIGAGTNPVTPLAVGATGTALLGVTGADPAFGNVIVGVKIQTFAATGTYTPSTGLISTQSECWGAGGGGGGTANTAANIGSGGAGGGAGSWCLKVSTAAAIGASQAVTIGTAGTAGTAGNNAGGNGGDSSVGTLCIGKGGTGGAGSAGSGTAIGGAGGVSGTGDQTNTGQPGGSNAAFTGTQGISGNGGSGTMGGGGVSAASGATTASGNPGTGRGSGGSGGASFNAGGTASGGAGTAGYCKLTEFVNQ
jgi:hypothetical protein